MSRTLKLIDLLFAQAQSLHQLGRSQDAFRILGRLRTYQSAWKIQNPEVEMLTGEILLKERRFVLARRILSRAVKSNSKDARLHYIYALANCRGRGANPNLAVRSLRIAVGLKPRSAKYHAALGRVEIRLGNAKVGIDHLYRATQLTPKDPKIFSWLIKALYRTRRSSEARGLIIAAQFQRAGNPRISALLNHLKFRRTRIRQKLLETRFDLPRPKAEPVLLRFAGPKRNKALKRSESTPSPIRGAAVKTYRGMPKILRFDQRHAL